VLGQRIVQGSRHATVDEAVSRIRINPFYCRFWDAAGGTQQQCLWVFSGGRVLTWGSAPRKAADTPM
jgi:hypothetical protein